MEPRPRRRFGWFLGACRRFAVTGAFSTARVWAPTLGVAGVLWLPAWAGLRVVWTPGPEAGVLLWIASFALALVGSFIVRFAVAPYFVWCKERDARELAETELVRLKARDHITGPLLAFAGEGRRLGARGHDMVKPTLDQQAAFKLERRDWEARVSTWMDANMHPDAKEHFLAWEHRHPKEYSGFSQAAAFKDHEWEINVVFYLVRNLNEMIKESHWDRR